MTKAKAVAKPSKSDIDWEQHEKILSNVGDLQTLIVYVVLASSACILITALIIFPSLDRIDKKLDTFGNQMDALSNRQLETNQALDQLVSKANDTSPFCYGTDQYGNKGYGIDITKISEQCEVSQ
jgi:hypothetical protein